MTVRGWSVEITLAVPHPSQEVIEKMLEALKEDHPAVGATEGGNLCARVTVDAPTIHVALHLAENAVCRAARGLGLGQQVVGIEAVPEEVGKMTEHRSRA